MKMFDKKIIDKAHSENFEDHHRLVDASNSLKTVFVFSTVIGV